MYYNNRVQWVGPASLSKSTTNNFQNGNSNHVDINTEHVFHKTRIKWESTARQKDVCCISTSYATLCKNAFTKNDINK